MRLDVNTRRGLQNQRLYRNLYVKKKLKDINESKMSLKVYIIETMS